MKFKCLSKLMVATSRRTGLCAWLLGGLTALTSCGGSSEGVMSTPAAASPPQAMPSPAGTPARLTLPVSYADGALSVRDGTDLRSVLAQIESRTGITVVVAPSIGSPRVAGDVVGTPLIDGLLQLLRDYDVLLSFRAAGRSQSILQTLWVYPKGSGPFPARAASRSDRDRTSALIVAKTAGELGQELLSSVAADRLNALSRSLDMQIELPEYALQHLAGTDPDPLARRLALVAIGRAPASNSPAARVAAQLALQDTDLTVREQAKNLLEQLDMAALPSDMLPLPVMSQ